MKIDNNIGNEGVEYLSESLKNNKTLTYLDLRCKINSYFHLKNKILIYFKIDNKINNEGLMVFLTLLKVNIYLTDVFIIDNQQEIDEYLKNNKKLLIQRRNDFILNMKIISKDYYHSNKSNNNSSLSSSFFKQLPKEMIQQIFIDILSNSFSFGEFQKSKKEIQQLMRSIFQTTEQMTFK